VNICAAGHFHYKLCEEKRHRKFFKYWFELDTLYIPRIVRQAPQARFFWYPLVAENVVTIGIYNVSQTTTCSSWCLAIRIRTTTQHNETDRDKKKWSRLSRLSDLMWTWTPICGEIEVFKKKTKIPGNALSDVLLKLCLQNFAADSANKKSRCARFLENRASRGFESWWESQIK